MKWGIYSQITLFITLERLNLHKLFDAPAILIGDVSSNSREVYMNYMSNVR